MHVSFYFLNTYPYLWELLQACVQEIFVLSKIIIFFIGLGGGGEAPLGPLLGLSLTVIVCPSLSYELTIFFSTTCNLSCKIVVAKCIFMCDTLILAFLVFYFQHESLILVTHMLPL